MSKRRSCQRSRLDGGNLSLPSQQNMFMLAMRVNKKMILLLSMVLIQLLGSNLQKADKPLIGRFDSSMIF